MSNADFKRIHASFTIRGSGFIALKPDGYIRDVLHQLAQESGFKVLPRNDTLTPEALTSHLDLVRVHVTSDLPIDLNATTPLPVHCQNFSEATIQELHKIKLQVLSYNQYFNLLARLHVPLPHPTSIATIPTGLCALTHSNPQFNVDINSQDHEGNTVLHILCKNLFCWDEDDMRSKYYSLGRPVQFRFTHECTGFYSQILYRIQQLLKHFTLDVTIQNNEGLTAWDYVYQYIASGRMNINLHNQPATDDTNNFNHYGQPCVVLLTWFMDNMPRMINPRTQIDNGFIYHFASMVPYWVLHTFATYADNHDALTKDINKLIQNIFVLSRLFNRHHNDYYNVEPHSFDFCMGSLTAGKGLKFIYDMFLKARQAFSELVNRKVNNTINAMDQFIITMFINQAQKKAGNNAVVLKSTYFQPLHVQLSEFLKVPYSILVDRKNLALLGSALGVNHFHISGYYLQQRQLAHEKHIAYKTNESVQALAQRLPQLFQPKYNRSNSAKTRVFECDDLVRLIFSFLTTY